MKINIAIDGPMGAGKSTVADALAEKLGILHLDTGAMYRAFAYACKLEGIKDDDNSGIKRMMDTSSITVGFKNGKQITYLNGIDVNPYIRTAEISMKASNLSKLGFVREKLVAEQRKIAKNNDVIIDGRDIGTNVLTDAEIKIYLTAKPEIRAMRRYKEQSEKSYEQILADLKERDIQDSTRKINPLKKADDAILVDTSDMSFDESIEYIYRIVKDHYAERK